jgi:hypothetical protein
MTDYTKWAAKVAEAARAKIFEALGAVELTEQERGFIYATVWSGGTDALVSLLQKVREADREEKAPADSGAAAAPAGWRETRVGIDGVFGPYPAQIQVDNRWNGAVIPRFTREVAEQIRQGCELEAQGNPEAVVLRWDGDNLLVIHPAYAEPDVVEPVDGFFGVGQSAWYWSEWEDEEEAETPAESRQPERFPRSQG